jgi:sulfur-carrier protein
MAIIVILPIALQPFAAYNERVFVDAATVHDALSTLFERYPALDAELPEDLGQPPVGTALYRNGVDLRKLQGLDTPLVNKDRLTIVVPSGSM